MRRFLVILAWPLIEIGLFVWIGGAIGVWSTLAWVVLTAVAGVFLLRYQAARGAMLLRGGLGRPKLPEGMPVAGLMRGLAAVLLILPGFLTDALGILLLLPPVQALVSASVMRRFAIFGGGQASGAAPKRSETEVIDGEWIEVPPEANRNRRPSGWTEIDG